MAIYRNLQEQVEKNMKDIEELKNVDTVKANDFILDGISLKDSLFYYIKNVNITDTLTLTNRYLDKANGNANPDANSKCTNYIDLSTYTGFLISGHSQYATTLICTYDENKTFLRSYGDGTSAGITFTDYQFIPQSDEKFVRFSTYLYTQYPLKVVTIGGELVPITDKKKDNYLFNKKYVACGDSFTKGDVISSDKVYPYLIAQRNNMRFVNMAHNGSYCHYGENGFTNPNNSYYYQNIPLDADIITIAYGLNEISTPIGTKDSNDNTTIWGAYNEVLGWITTNIPNAKVGIISNDAWMTYELRNALQEIASYWGVEFLDLKEYGKPFMISGKYSQDGDTNPSVVSQRTTQYCVSSQNGHPNELGHKVRSYIVENFLRGAYGVDNSYTRKETDTKLAEAKAYADKAINDLRWELGSHTLDVESDTTTAYSKSVPSGAIGCQINKVGGMSYKNENLIVLNDVAETERFSFKYKISNGKLYIKKFVDDSTSSNAIINLAQPIIFIANKTYYLNQFNTNNVISIRLLDNDNTSITTLGILANGTFTPTETKVATKIQWFGSGEYNVELVYSPMITENSVTEFKQGFTGIRDSAVTSVVSKGSSNNTIDTLTIPTEIQNLTGYGWGINDTCYNYIDFEHKMFVQKVGRVKAKDLTWIYDSMYSRFKAQISDLKVTQQRTLYFVISNYTTQIGGGIDTNWNMIIYNSNQEYGIYIHDHNYTNATDFENHFTNTDYIYYELATPIETDISAYLTRDTIDIEGGGSLEFTNTYNNDVLSDIDYLIEEVKA